MIYAVVTTLRYENELAEIAEDTERLERELQSSVYHVLERDPSLGSPLRDTDLWTIRRRASLGLFFVDIYYRINVATQTVTLVSIRRIETTAL